MARSGDGAHVVAPDIGLLLDQIEREAVPERLLALASKLQAALVERRLAERPSPRRTAATAEQPV